MSVFAALHNTKKQRNFNITPYGDFFYYLTYWDKIQNLEGYIFEKCFTTYKNRHELPGFAQWMIYHVHSERRQILAEWFTELYHLPL